MQQPLRQIAFIIEELEVDTPAQQLLDRFLIGYPLDGDFHQLEDCQIHVWLAPDANDSELRRRMGDFALHRHETIELTTLDAFCELHGIAAIDFLKLDVEGHELAVLQGAGNMINSGNLRLIQFEFGPANIYSRTYYYDFWQLLSDRYRIFRIVPRGLVAIDAYREQNEVFLTSNFLAIRQ